MVVKIIPIALDPAEKVGEEVVELGEELPYSSECTAVLREIGISQGVGEMEGFVNFRGFVVRTSVKNRADTDIAFAGCLLFKVIIRQSYSRNGIDSRSPIRPIPTSRSDRVCPFLYRCERPLMKRPQMYCLQIKVSP